jgi:hypothetical protein
VQILGMRPCVDFSITRVVKKHISARARCYKPSAFGYAAGRVLVLSRSLKRGNETRDGVHDEIGARAAQCVAGGFKTAVALMRGQGLQGFER